MATPKELTRNGALPAGVSTSWYRNWIYIGSTPIRPAHFKNKLGRFEAINSSTKKPLVIMHP